MGEPSQLLTFQFTCPETRAWLVLQRDDQRSCVLEMQQHHPSVWSASADLIPGEYRCRYYSGDDRRVNYYGPAHIDGGIECGMDTLVSVKLSETTERPDRHDCAEQAPPPELLQPPSGI